MHYDEKGLVTAVRGALLCSGLIGLAACGGGGGGDNVRSTPPPVAPQTPIAPPPTTPTAPVVSAPDPNFSQHITLTNTAGARQAGFTGAGVRIGVIDSGVMRTHPALAPRVAANFNAVSSPPNNLQVDDVLGHGTAVAQIAAGTAFGAWPGGIAPGAELVSVRILADTPPTDDGSGQGNEVDGALGLRQIHQQLISSGVRVMNNSWGGLYWSNPVATNPIADEYRPFIHNNNGLVVFATGNDGRPNPDSMGALPSQPGPNGTLPAADLERGWLAVTAVNPSNVQQLDVDPKGVIYANACGVAMRYCLAAPGTVVFTGTNDKPTAPTYWRNSGTSFAAPQVSGAAALVWQAFPYFSNDLVRQTLLGTATDLGAPGPDDTFGYGLLDVGRAVRGPMKFDWGMVTADFDTVTSTWANPISGAGGLIKNGTGTLVLSSNNTYTGPTQVNGGTLRVSGSLYSVTAPSTVSVGPQGTLSSNSAIAANVTNAGTVAVDGNATMAIFGNYRQTSTGRLAVIAGDHLFVDGTAQIEGGALHVLGKKSYVSVPASHVTVLRADDGLTGQFSSLTAATGIFLTATLGYSTTEAWLDITRLDVPAAAQSLGLSAASVSSAQRVEAAFDAIDAGQAGEGASDELLAGAGAIQGSPTSAAAEQTLSSLSGELHGADTAFAMMAIEGNRRALESRIDALRAPSWNGTSYGPGEGGAWFENLDSQRALARFDMQADGWMAGQDRRIGALTIGAALAQTEGWAYHDQRFDREHNRQLEAQFYASHDLGPGYVLGSLALGRMQRWMHRDVLLGADAFRIGADYAQRYASVGVQAGWPLRVGAGRVTPYAGVQNLRLERDGFSEAGAVGFGLSADASSLRVSQALLGARFTTQWAVGTTQWDLQARAEWQHLLSQSGADVQARFTALDVWSPILGGALDRDVGVLGMGIGTWLRGGARLSLDVDARHDHGQAWTQAMFNWSKAF